MSAGKIIVERCPQCGGELPPGEVVECPYCGSKLARPQEPSDKRTIPLGWTIPTAVLQQAYGYEYRSRVTLGGLPLVHIAQGLDPQTGRMRVARGIIAIGNVAIGVLAVGGFAIGGIAIGGIAVGVLALAGIVAGLLSLGGISLGLLVAVGGIAVSAQYAIGGLALAPHALGANAQDPQLLRLLEQWFGPER